MKKSKFLFSLFTLSVLFITLSAESCGGVDETVNPACVTNHEGTVVYKNNSNAAATFYVKGNDYKGADPRGGFPVTVAANSQSSPFEWTTVKNPYTITIQSGVRNETQSLYVTECKGNSVSFK